MHVVNDPKMGLIADRWHQHHLNQNPILQRRKQRLKPVMRLAKATQLRSSDVTSILRFV